MHEAEDARQSSCLCLLAGARRSRDDNAWRSLGRVVLVAQLKQFHEVVDDIRLRLLRSVVLEDELVESLSHALEVQIIFLQALSRKLFELVTIKLRRDLD